MVLNLSEKQEEEAMMLSSASGFITLRNFLFLNACMQFPNVNASDVCPMREEES